MKAAYQNWRSGSRAGVILPQWNGADFSPEKLLDLPDSPQARVCKAGKKIRAAADGTYFVKRYSHASILKSLLHIFAPSRPMLGLKGSLRAEELGLCAPEVIAAVRETKFGIFPAHDWLITRDLGADAVFANQLPLTRELAGELAELLAVLHDGGMIHGDAQLRNLYRETHSGRWGVIDLDGCRLFDKPLSRGNRRKELARLASSFSRMAKWKNVPLDWNVPEEFAKKYHARCGVDLNDSAYLRRYRYLNDRVRKK